MATGEPGSAHFFGGRCGEWFPVPVLKVERQKASERNVSLAWECRKCKAAVFTHQREQRPVEIKQIQCFIHTDQKADKDLEDQKFREIALQKWARFLDESNVDPALKCFLMSISPEDAVNRFFERPTGTGENIADWSVSMDINVACVSCGRPGLEVHVMQVYSHKMWSGHVVSHMCRAVHLVTVKDEGGGKMSNHISSIVKTEASGGRDDCA